MTGLDPVIHVLPEALNMTWMCVKAKAHLRYARAGRRPRSAHDGWWECAI